MNQYERHNSMTWQGQPVDGIVKKSERQENIVDMSGGRNVVVKN